jgi:GDP-mannose 6-dehydrogenase
MKISIFGLGYVGAVTAGCLTEQGHQVIGVDVQPQKVDDFNRGQAPIIEPGLDALFWQAYGKGFLRATLDAKEAIAASEVSLVCVGTPLTPTGTLDLTHVQQVTRQIAEVLRRQGKRHTVMYRSTMLPGSMEQLAQDCLADLMAQGQVEALYYPEFLRESTAVGDFRDPSLVVVGTREGGALAPELKPLLGERARVVNWRTAEMLKCACNAFHATKVAFANEIGRLSKQAQVDGLLVMNLLCEDTRLNLSSNYLQPGNPFGGSCLPKDVRALGERGRQQGLSLPMLENLLASNQRHLQSLMDWIEAQRPTEVVILGLSFKSNTDDLRESPMVEVAQKLLLRGCQVRIYDPQLNLARIVGSNKRVIETKIPALASLLHEDLASALGKGGLVLAAQRCAALSEMARWITAQHQVLDINGWTELRKLPARYEGFCW